MNETLILEKLKNIDKCLLRINSKLNGDENKLDDLDVQDIFVLNLQRAIQLAIDVASHILKHKRLPLPATMKEYFLSLGSNNIIESKLADNLSRMVGFRNIAVHDYEDLDIDILKSIASKHLVDIIEFQKAIIRLLNDIAD
jgi:uncharacterized protein YutE (UPF0331/DUF86 family)